MSLLEKYSYRKYRKNKLFAQLGATSYFEDRQIPYTKECLWHYRVCFHCNGNGFSNPNASRET